VRLKVDGFVAGQIVMQKVQQRPARSWPVAIVIAFSLALVALIPQLCVLVAKHDAWAGSYVSLDFDEPAYSAYLGALIDGEPRLNDPYTGRSDHPYSVQPETLFSIQFIPAYFLAIPARFFGLSASTMLIALRPLVSFLSTLAVFWLLNSISLNKRVSAVGTLIVLCLGSFVASPSEFQLGFLRGYLPSLPFPLFFLYCGLGWKAVTVTERKKYVLYALLQGSCFAVLVFSYFFLWTAAAAWFCGFILFVLILHPTRFRQILQITFISASISILALIPYAILLSRRAAEMDAAQLLVKTHTPDLWHISELICAILIFVILVRSRRDSANLDTPVVAIALSFAALPFLLFNQQVLTGRLLQPLHYTRYVIPYAVAIAVITAWTALTRRERTGDLIRLNGPRSLTIVAISILIFSAIASAMNGRAHLKTSLATDEKWLGLRQTAALLRHPDNLRLQRIPVVFYTDLVQADLSPTTRSGAVLWSQHMFVFSGSNLEENLQRLFCFLYFSGVKPGEFRSMAETNSYVSLALFGFERVCSRDTGSSLAISSTDVDIQEQRYTEFISSFNLEKAKMMPIDFVVTPSDYGPDISVVDRWYQLDAGTNIGGFTIYSVTPRQ
jgi:hypothetical protein